MLGGLLALAVLPVSAAGSIANFNIDGQIQRQSTPDDWADGPGGAGVLTGFANRAAACATGTGAGSNPELICDDVKSDSDTFPGGAKESDPAGWIPYGAGQMTPKDDITNIYAAGRVDTSNSNHPVLLSGMERLPKSGDLHLDFEYNKEMTGTAPNLIPVRRVNDILVAYDLGGGRQSNSDAVEVRVYKAVKDVATCTTNCTAHFNYDAPDVALAGTGTLSGSGVVAQINGATINCGSPWQCYDETNTLVNTLPAFSFFEAGIDLQTSLGLSNTCINFVTVKSRASTSVTSQLKDTTKPRSFPFCGGLAVKKYIDVDQSGTITAGDITTTPASGDNPLDGWFFTVNGPAAGGGIGPVVCNGTTNANGSVVCTGANQSLTTLSPGTYTVTELAQSSQTNNAGFFNTDPGPAPGTTAQVSAVTKTQVIGLGSASTVNLGNTCFVDVTFTVNNLPSGLNNPFVYYQTTAGVGPTTVTKTALPAPTNGSSSVTVNDTFAIGSAIDWGFGINLGGSEQTKAATSFTIANVAANRYPNCSIGPSTGYAATTVSGLKFKDINSDGVLDADGIDNVGGNLDDEKPLAGFVFELKSGTTVKDSAVSGTDGTYSFTGVNPGTYTVHERVYSEGAETTGAATGSRSPTGWKKTTADRTVTVSLGDATKSVDDTGNTPLSNLSVVFTPQTSPASTQATVSCKDASNTALSGGSSSTDSAGQTTYTANDLELKQSQVVCTITMTDP